MTTLPARALACTRALALMAAALLAACANPDPPPASAPGAPLTAAEMPPPEPREFRAAWVATVANIDWPSRPGLSGQAQRTEVLALLDRARTIGLNALILQVRPAADAIYPSTLEPWSEYLSGEQGRPPWLAAESAWDPLAFWVAQAQRRGIELHVWLNPYRARQQSAKSPLVAPHLAVRQPGLVKRYGEQLWIDPGEPAAATHTLAVVADVLRRYEVDGVHIDDYFYPYPVTPPGGTEQAFPDDDSWARYTAGGGTLVRDDWRRSNVDALVQALHQTVQTVRPGTRLGISPFGIGRPDRRPAGITGFSQYDKLYADVERWLKEGWMDYLAPQLYWPIDRAGQQFPVLLDYWLGQNPQARHIWPGLFTSQVTRGEALGLRVWSAREIIDQVGVQRSRAAATGHIHFSMAALMQDRDGIATLLQAGPYAVPALVPATPWRAIAPRPPPPSPPVLRLAPGQAQIEPARGPDAALWAVWRRIGGQWRFAVQPGAERTLATAGADALVVSAVDRLGQTSTRNAVRLP